MLSISLFFALGKTSLKNQKIWIRVILVIILAIASELLITDRIEAVVVRYLNRRFEINILELTVQKSNNREAAIKALEFYNASIEEEYPNDPKFWTPFKGIFKEYAEVLKKS